MGIWGGYWRRAELHGVVVAVVRVLRKVEEGGEE